MRTARAQAEVVLTPEAALRLWSDADRWTSFVEGFGRVVDKSPNWPAGGARIIWESTPAGRGRVTEKVAEKEGPDRFVTQVFEERLHGIQTFRAVESEGGSRAELSLEYTLTKYGPVSAIADAIFIRRAIRDSLRRTLARFAVEAEDEAGLR
jgi:polyketide cyclase/dehydrase/lipid transport protein